VKEKHTRPKVKSGGVSKTTLFLVFPRKNQKNTKKNGSRLHVARLAQKLHKNKTQGNHALGVVVSVNPIQRGASVKKEAPSRPGERVWGGENYKFNLHGTQKTEPQML